MSASPPFSYDQEVFSSKARPNVAGLSLSFSALDLRLDTDLFEVNQDCLITKAEFNERALISSKLLTSSLSFAALDSPFWL